jgi:hypothetical protein
LLRVEDAFSITHPTMLRLGLNQLHSFQRFNPLGVS